MSRPAKLHVDTHALRHNLQRVRELAPNSKILAMVKANAYGHGLSRVARALKDVDAFGVACLEEALLIRKAGIINPIVLVEGFFDENELEKIIELDCEIVIHNINQVQTLENIKIKKPLKVWLKINTGMCRLGFLSADISQVYKRILNNVNVDGTPKLLTHFADADDPSKPTTKKQIKLFQQTTSAYSGEKSLANSAGILAFSEAHADWVRPGGLLFGVSPLLGDVGSNHGLKSVMTLESEIIATQQCKKGDAIGYGGAWQCPENMLVGIVAIGYGDGYPRHAKVGTPILVNGHECSLIGRVAMDMLAVDLRKYSDVKVGDKVVLWGGELPVEVIAKYADTIAYELLCGIARRVKGAE